jgi:hypothetical protein
MSAYLSVCLLVYIMSVGMSVSKCHSLCQYDCLSIRLPDCISAVFQSQRCLYVKLSVRLHVVRRRDARVSQNLVYD